jgi:hypothetical protein
VSFAGPGFGTLGFVGILTEDDGGDGGDDGDGGDEDEDGNGLSAQMVVVVFAGYGKRKPGGNGALVTETVVVTVMEIGVEFRRWPRVRGAG